MGRVLGPLLALAALMVDALGPAPGGPGVSLVIASLIAAYRTRGVLASVLALMALGLTLQEGAHALWTPLMWAAHVALGCAIGSVSRHLEGPLLGALKAFPTQVGLGLVITSLFVLLLPNSLVHFMDAQGEPLMLSVTLSEPEFTTQLPVLIPARLVYDAPLAVVTSWATWWALITGVCVILAGLLTDPRASRVATVALAILSLLLVIPALADLAQLASAQSVALPNASELIIELGWTSGGVSGLQVHEPPSEAYLSLASRPVTSVLHGVMGLVLIAFLIGVRAPKDAATTPRGSSGWCWFGAAAGLVAWIAFMAFASPLRMDAIAPWGPSPVSYSALAGALVVASAALGGLFSESAHPWSLALECLAIVLWCSGIVAPIAGWLSL